MKKDLLYLFFLISNVLILSGQQGYPFKKVAEIKWETDNQLFLKMINDSNYVFDIRALFHIPKGEINFEADYIYYPVNFGEDYINDLKWRNNASSEDQSNKSLWGTLHKSLGGGWVHFINCLLYSFETNQLTLTAPLMKRPDTKWKPNPVTDSYLRTRKWKYYVPVEQKNAMNEYKYRKEKNELGDLNSIPVEFIDLFLNTGTKVHNQLKNKGDVKSLAKIDLVKLILGSNFLGDAQILYIRSSVLNAVKNYSVNKLPSVIIFDEFEAAAVMTLNLTGYSLDAIVFKKASEMTVKEAEERKRKITGIVDSINLYNHNSFIRMLKNYYQE